MFFQVSEGSLDVVVRQERQRKQEFDVLVLGSSFCLCGRQSQFLRLPPAGIREVKGAALGGCVGENLMHSLPSTWNGKEKKYEYLDT